jgi:NAD(P)-dependent dehydrogenase (short-subunit alcohol dehydrogenase family)
MGELDGRVAIVTGAGSGIGRGVALLLASEGAAVIVFDRDAAAAEATAHQVAADGGRAAVCTGDVTVSADCHRAVSQAVDRFGRLDVVINSAGIIRRADVVATTEDEWDRVMDVNAKSIFLFGKHAVPVMAAGGGGSIVNIASGWGLKGGANAAAYCASKGAAVLLTRAMAIDHGPQSIRVNCVCPGDTDTPMLRDEARQLGESDEAFLAEAAARPLARLGTPQDMAQAVLFLVSDRSSWVTGASLVVDGGGLA